jgi:Flp pilus assembly protein TadG
MRASTFAAALLLALCASPALADDADTIRNRLAALEGNWSGTGTWLNKPSRVTASWTRTLNGAFLRHDYAVGSSDGSAAFEGTAYYRPVLAGAGAATWFDSQGSMHPIETALDGEALVALWGPVGAPIGKTHYTQVGDRLVIEDWIRSRSGAWRPFSKSELSRRK